MITVIEATKLVSRKMRVAVGEVIGMLPVEFGLVKVMWVERKWRHQETEWDEWRQKAVV